MSAGAKFTFSAKVDKVDSETGIVELRDGREISGDLVVGADGLMLLFVAPMKC